MFVSGYLNCQRSKTEKDKEYDLIRVYQENYRIRGPCSNCGGRHQYHYATCDGRNLCHNCYIEQGSPLTQLYPGDKGHMPDFGSMIFTSGSYNAS